MQSLGDTGRSPLTATMSVTLAQPKIEHESTIENTKAHCHLIDHAADRLGRLVVFPELCTTEYFCTTEPTTVRDRAETLEGPSVSIMRDWSLRNDRWVAFPIFESGADGALYNSVILTDPQGGARSVYRKIHVPRLVGAERIVDETRFFEPGPVRPSTVAIDGMTVGFGICWDRLYPELYRHYAAHGASAVIIVSATQWGLGAPNDEAPDAAWQREHWISTLSQMAFLNGVYVVAVNRVGRERGGNFFGLSLVSSPWGRIESICAEAAEEVLTAHLTESVVKHARSRVPISEFVRRGW